MARRSLVVTAALAVMFAALTASQPRVRAAVSAATDPLPAAAEEACASSFADPVVGGEAKPRLRFLLQPAEATGADGWHETSLVPYLEGKKAKNVHTLVCLREVKVVVDEYVASNGARIPASRVDWDVRLVSWPEGAVLAANFYAGSDPPLFLILPQGEPEGFPPTAAVLQWLGELFDAPGIGFETGGVRALALSADGTSLATVRREGSANVTVRNGADAQERYRIDPAAAGQALALSPDGRILALGGGNTQGAGGRVTLWDVVSGQQYASFDAPGPVYALSWSVDGAYLAATGAGGVSALVWDVVGGQEVFRGPAGAPAGAIAFSADGRFFAAAQGTTIAFWRVGTWKSSRLAVTTDGYPSGIAFSPDSKTLAVRTWQEIVVARFHGSQIVGRFTVPSAFDAAGTTGALAFSADGALLAAGQSDGSITIWDVANGEVAGTREDHAAKVVGVAFAPDGKRLVSGSEDGLVLAREW